MWDVTSPTRDGTLDPTEEVQSPNNWATREVAWRVLEQSVMVARTTYEEALQTRSRVICFSFFFKISIFSMAQISF